MDEQGIPQIERPRSAFDLLGATVDIYRRYPLLFVALAFAVVVPYEVIVLLATGTGPLGGGHLSTGTMLLLLAIEGFLINPVVSALLVHAVDDAREGRDPTLGSVARRGLVTLPVVVAAAIIALLGIAAGFFLLIVPGIYLSLRWAVVAQSAALDEESWVDALRRSGELTDKNFLHIIGVLLLVGLIGGGATYLVGVGFDRETTTAASFVVGVAVAVIVRSFTALAAALLYFDLKARERMSPAARRLINAPNSPPAQEHLAPPSGHPLDPASWSDEERPAGWYIDPDDPTKMRYWPAGYQPQWSSRRTRTPSKTLEEWTAHRERAEGIDRDESA
jgi:hypothetical protein